MVTCFSNKKVWWHLPFNDLETGEHFDFEWQAIIASRVQGNGCPFLVGQSVWPGYNDLASRRPDLVAQWHPTKNGGLTPESQIYMNEGCVRRWWRCSKCEYEWRTTVCARTVHGVSCPNCRRNRENYE